MTSIKALLALGCVVWAAAFQLAVSWAYLAPYDGIGGNGGAPFRLDCGEWGILVGITGRSGAVVDQVGGLCVKIDPRSATWVGGVYETARVGGSGGGPFRKACPVGHALMGVEGSTTYAANTTVVRMLDIKCISLGIHRRWDGSQIMGTRMVFNGDPEPHRIAAAQHLCEPPLKPDGHHQRAWGRVGLAFEGRAGLYLDRIRLVCNSMPQDKNGYRVEFRSSAQGEVPQGTPLQISWRATGVKPEFTPSLQYSWELYDETHVGTGSGPFGGIAQPSRVANPCVYLQGPCGAGWLGASTGSGVVFNSLPPANYELRLAVKPTVAPAFSEVAIESGATIKFAIGPNQLIGLVVTPNKIRAGGTTTATITFEGPVIPRGVTVFLSSSNPQWVAVPPSVVVPGGRPSVNVGLRADAKAYGGGQVQITASLHKPIDLQVAAQSTLRAARATGQSMAELPSDPATASAAPGVADNSSPFVINRNKEATAPTTTQAIGLAKQMGNLPSAAKTALLTVESSVVMQRPSPTLRNYQIVK